MRAALVVVFLAMGCGEPVTEIVVCYRADDAYVLARSELFVTARPRRGGTALYDSSIGVATGEGETQGFIRAMEDGIDVTLRTGALPSGGVVTQRARVAFGEGRIVGLVLRVEPSCEGVPCAADATCVRGVCEPIDVRPECSADYGSAALPPCDARSTERCE